MSKEGYTVGINKNTNQAMITLPKFVVKEMRLHDGSLIDWRFSRTEGAWYIVEVVPRPK